MRLSHREHCERSRADAVASSFTEFMHEQLAPGGEEAARATHGLAYALGLGGDARADCSTRVPASTMQMLPLPHRQGKSHTTVT